MLRSIAADVRYACRLLKRSPGFSIVAVLTLSLGVGTNTAFFAIGNALLNRFTPAAHVDGAFSLTEPTKRTYTPWPGLSIRSYRALEAHPPAAAGLVAASTGPLSRVMQVPGKAEQLVVQGITGGYGRIFDLTTQAGRWISSDDDGAAPAMSVVVSDRVWREWFNADPAIAGTTTIKINLKPFTVVGVAAKDFAGLDPGWIDTDLWIPLGAYLAVSDFKPDALETMRFSTFVRPAPGVSAPRFATEMGVATAANPAATAGAAMPILRPLARSASAEFRLARFMALGISSLILLAACANLANMLLARGVQRTSETAVRVSLGASATRVLRLYLVEAGVIGVIAGAVGLAIALGTLALFARVSPGFGALRRLPFTPAADYRTFLYAVGASLLATLVVGLATAWRASRISPQRALASGGAPIGLTAHGGRTRTALVAVQVTVAVLFVLGAGLFWEQYKKDRDRNGPPVHTRYDVDQLATASIDLKLLQLTEAQRLAFLERLVTTLGTVPGIEHAAIADGIPTSTYTNLTPEEPAGGRVGAPTLTRVWYSRTSPGFLATIGTRLLRGRDFSAFDVAGAPPVAIVSESAAKDIAPDGEAIGRRMQFGPWEWLTIVGVFSDPVSTADAGPARASNVMYVPFAQWPQSDAIVVVRTATPDAVLDPLRQVIRELNEEVPIFSVSTLRDQLSRRVGADQAMDALMLSQSAVALGIAMLGVYGVVAYYVSMRTREFGIRLALGATPGRVVKMVIDHAIHIVLIGLLPGVLIASLSSRLIQSRTFNLMPNDIPTWFAVPVLILVAGVIAGYMPARRAARTDPNVALRNL